MGELKRPKRYYEINWPLVAYNMEQTSWKLRCEQIGIGNHLTPLFATFYIPGIFSGSMRTDFWVSKQWQNKCFTSKDNWK